MTRSLTIRRYDPADADRVWDVHERAMRASPLPFVENAPGDEPLTDVSTHYLENGGEFLVGLADGVIVAVGGFRRIADGTAEIKHIRVHPDHRRNGYGERLVRALEKRVRAAGIERVVLWTNEELTAARALYEDLGYDVIDRETRDATGYVFVRYQKRIAE